MSTPTRTYRDYLNMEIKRGKVIFDDVAFDPSEAKRILEDALEALNRHILDS